jgi:toxin ParE1/3/4
MSRLIVSPAARSDLLDIWDFISYENSRAADRIIKEITARFETLLAFPQSGGRRDELKEGLRSFGVERYIVFYFIIEDGIKIARVLHCAQDIESIFADE